MLLAREMVSFRYNTKNGILQTAALKSDEKEVIVYKEESSERM